MSCPETFWRQFLATALWSSTHHDTCEPLDNDYGPEDIDESTLKDLREDCDDFWGVVGSMCELDPERAGHDFWLTRNGHGAGFWDGDWPEPDASKLTDWSKTYGGVDLLPGDDGRLY